jgi:hypothetical protein
MSWWVTQRLYVRAPSWLIHFPLLTLFIYRTPFSVEVAKLHFAYVYQPTPPLWRGRLNITNYTVHSNNLSLQTVLCHIRTWTVWSFILKGKVLHYRRHFRQIKMNVKFYVKCNVFLSAAPSSERWWNIICEVLKIEALFRTFLCLRTSA